MSVSPAACSFVRSRYRIPSGSSCASEPTITSCTSGTSRRISRNASITPIGSFHGSKRDTCEMSGRSGSMPNGRTTASHAGSSIGAFFGLSGSIDGGIERADWVRHARLDVLLGGEDRGVEPVHDRFEEIPDGAIRRRQVDVAPPDPSALPLALVLEHRQHGRRLGVVDQDDVEFPGELRRVRSDPLPVRRLHLVLDLCLGALQRVVHGLRDREERVGSLDQRPASSRRRGRSSAGPACGAAPPRRPRRPCCSRAGRAGLGGAGPARRAGPPPPAPRPPRTRRHAWAAPGRSGARPESTEGSGWVPKRAGVGCLSR